MRARVHTRHNKDNPSVHPANRGVLPPLHPGNLPSIAPKVSAKSPSVPAFGYRKAVRGCPNHLRNTHTDGMFVVPGGMRSHLVEGTPGMNHAVAGDVVVIADVGKATGTMVTTAIVHGITLRGAGGTTMDHNQIDAAVVLVLATGQNSITHHPQHACMPKAVARAVNTVIVIFRILLQMLLFVSFSIVLCFMAHR